MRAARSAPPGRGWVKGYLTHDPPLPLTPIGEVRGTGETDCDNHWLASAIDCKITLVCIVVASFCSFFQYDTRE
jgi:hypothetical protein